MTEMTRLTTRSWLVEAYISGSERLSSALGGIPHFAWMAIMAGATRMMIGWLHTGKPKKTNRADEIRKAYKERQARMKKD